MKRREKSELQEHCCCRQGGCIFQVMISQSNNKLKEFMTLCTELKIIGKNLFAFLNLEFEITF